MTLRTPTPMDLLLKNGDPAAFLAVDQSPKRTMLASWLPCLSNGMLIGMRSSVVPVMEVEIWPLDVPPRIVDALPMAFCSCLGKFLVAVVTVWRKANVGCRPGPKANNENEPGVVATAEARDAADEKRGRTCFVVMVIDV